MKLSTRLFAALPAFFGFILLSVGASYAQSNAVFYAGKTVKVIVGYGPGGGFDTYARLLTEYLPRHLAGAPTMIVQNMPGAGSVKATQYIVNVAPKDGTIIGIPNHNLFFDQLLKRRDLGFDMTKFNWIGRLGTRLSVGVVSSGTGVKSVTDAKAKQVTFGATGSTGGAAMIPAVLNNLLGTKFKVVSGYKGQADMYLALEKGELDGMATAVWEDLKSGAQSAWVKNGEVNILYVVSGEQEADLSGVPTLPELGSNPDQRAALGVLTAADVIGRAFYVAPEVPAGRVGVLRKAFLDMTTDPRLLADGRKRNVEIAPWPGDKLNAFLKDVAATPKPLIEMLQNAAGKPRAKKNKKKE